MNETINHNPEAAPAGASENQWDQLAAVPFQGEKATENPRDYSLEPLDFDIAQQQIERNGYQAKCTGEQTILAVNEEGNVNVVSAYLNAWESADKADPEFYKNPQNFDFSKALWDVGFQLMIDDLDPQSESKKDTPSHFPLNIWDSCTKLHGFMQNPEYEERAMEFLDKLDELGPSGEMALTAMETLETYKGKANLRRKSHDKAKEAELEAKREAYEKLNRRYEEAMSQSGIDSDVLEGIAIGYDKIRDYADSAARAQEIWGLLDRLEKIVSDALERL